MVGVLVLAITVYTPVFVQGALGAGDDGRDGADPHDVSRGCCRRSCQGNWLAHRALSRVPVLGGCLAVAGTLLVARAGAGTAGGEIALALLLVGAGMGMTWPVYMVATQNAVARTELGVASGALLFFRTMAGSVGVAVLGAGLTRAWASGSTRTRSPTALHTVFLFASLRPADCRGGDRTRRTSPAERIRRTELATCFRFGDNLLNDPDRREPEMSTAVQRVLIVGGGCPAPRPHWRCSARAST